MDKGNLYCFDYAVKNLPTDSPLIEIGAFCGLSTNMISYFLRKYEKPNKMVISDKWMFEGSEDGGMIGDSSISHPEYREFVMETFKRNINFFSSQNRPYPIEVFSDELFELWEKKATVKDIFDREITLGGGISFAYIDGNHTYEYAKRDFENTASFLDPGGFVLFDDSADYSRFGCARLMKEVVKHPEFSIGD